MICVLNFLIDWSNKIVFQWQCTLIQPARPLRIIKRYLRRCCCFFWQAHGSLVSALSCTFFVPPPWRSLVHIYLSDNLVLSILRWLCLNISGCTEHQMGAGRLVRVGVVLICECLFTVVPWSIIIFKIKPVCMFTHRC